VEIPQDTAAKEIREVVTTLLRARLRENQDSTGPESTSNGSRGDRTRLLAKLTKARQKLAAAKTKACIDLVEGTTQQGEKVLVFSCFDSPLKQIQKHFGDRCVLVTGATPVKKRQQLVDRFQNEEGVQVFAANIIAGGVGLNLTKARHVVFNDLDWVPTNHWQAEDRAYRIGQTSTVNVHYLVGAGTIDDFVRTLLETKVALVEAVTDGGALSPALTRDVLAELEEMLGNCRLDWPRLTRMQSTRTGSRNFSGRSTRRRPGRTSWLAGKSRPSHHCLKRH